MSKARDLGDAANKANFLDNVTSDIQAQLNSNTTAAANAVLPAGLILPFGGDSAPTGYLACDGSQVSRTTYATLFTAIGTTWGTGNGFSTFNLPDLRGAFLRGTGSHGTHNMANGNDFAGPSVGSFENDQMQGHAHRSFAMYPGNGSMYSAAGTFVEKSVVSPHTGNLEEIGNSSYQNVAEAKAYGGYGTPRVGDETRPFGAGVLYCIKT